MAVTSGTSSTRPRSVVPNASSLMVYQVPGVTVAEAVARVMGPEPVRLPSTTAPELLRPR
ncbi:hypothetical protein [Thermocatellispora tengchongensis]|uniref:hypothetical protein n=1 Tax=Thermocatellispora tengchongensis TaxID=1073253 RepID=UPI003640F57A